MGTTHQFSGLTSLRRIAQSFLYLIFPPLCLYCDEVPANPDWIFCQTCTALLQLIEPAERCHVCFVEMGHDKQRICSGCLKQPSLLTAAAAAMDYVGPAACLVKRLKYGQQPYLARAAAAFLVAQYVKLEWPMPDLVVPVPMPFLKEMARGYNQSVLIAQEFSRLIGRPAVQVLKRRHGDYSQAGLTLAQRQKLGGSTFVLTRSSDVADKCVLLIDDVMTSGSTMRRCAEALQEGCPASIYALTVCRAMRG